MAASFGNLKKAWLFSLTLGLLMLAFAFKLSTVHAQNLTIGSVQDCKQNSVMWCGAQSVSQIIDKYDNGDGHNSATSIQNIYSYYGIGSADINSLSSASVQVEAGSVTKANQVLDSSGKLIATDAITGGRVDSTGSTPVTVGATTFYVRPPSVSFLDYSLPAFVVIKNGQFQFAILASCGNAIKATPVTPATPKPTPKPTPPAPTAKPVPPTNVCSGTTVSVNNGGIASQGGNCSTNTTVVQSAPPAAPTPAGQCLSLALSISPTNPLAVTVTVNSQVENGASLQDVTYNFGDGSANLMTSLTTATHTYAQAGLYNLTATLAFAGSQAVAPAACQASVTLGSAPTPTITTPPVVTPAVATTTTPTTNLVNTGPGDVFGIFGATTVLGTLGFRWYTRRGLGL